MESITVALSLKEGATTPLSRQEILQRLTTQWLPPFFLPLGMSGIVAGKEVSFQPQEPLREWRGQVLLPSEFVEEDFPLSKILPETSSRADEIIANINLEATGTFVLLFYGGLYHYPPLPQAQPGWYGHFVVTAEGFARGSLWSITEVELAWYEKRREVCVHFTTDGYPLTSYSPRRNPDYSLQKTSDKKIVERNRRSLFQAIAKIQGLLELTPDEVEWTVDCDKASFLEDREALRQWQEILQRGLVS